jgi:hypothetical protein
MLFELVDTLQQRRRFILIALYAVASIVLLTFATQLLQAQRPDFAQRLSVAEKSAQALPEYDGAAGGIDRLSSSVETGMLRTAVSTADFITNTQHTIAHATKVSVHAVSTGLGATVHAASVAATTTMRAIGNTFLFIGRVLVFPFVASAHIAGYVFGHTSDFASTHLASIVQANSATEVPVITPEQAHQASLIQTDTINFEPIVPIGSGGACDNGNGNGGYPMEWCDARMDTIRTKAGSTDRINRQCTSYAYWYFTDVLGHTDFNVTGDAKYWARNSNYPVHAMPAVNAIAVETTGRYGHVAIVQALPGQEYDGKVVPDGYLLVSEMNYDWRGHFRYSYSPISKFSSYIYP